MASTGSSAISWHMAQACSRTNEGMRLRDVGWSAYRVLRREIRAWRLSGRPFRLPRIQLLQLGVEALHRPRNLPHRAGLHRRGWIRRNPCTGARSAARTNSCCALARLASSRRRIAISWLDDMLGSATIGRPPGLGDDSNFRDFDLILRWELDSPESLHGRGVSTGKQTLQGCHC